MRESGFWEIDQEQETGNIFFVVHSGSKNLGSMVCKYHQAKIDEASRFDYDTFHSEIKQFKPTEI